MASEKKRFQARTEPTFVFHHNRSAKVKTTNGNPVDDETFPNPSSLDKDSTDPHIRKRSQEKKKSASDGWFEDDFARIAESAQPENKSPERIEPDSRPKPKNPQASTTEGLAQKKPPSEKKPVTTPISGPEILQNKKQPPQVFSFKSPDEQKEGARDDVGDGYPDEKDDPFSFRPDYLSRTPTSGTIQPPYNKTQKRAIPLSLGSMLLSLIIGAGLGLYGPHYLHLQQTKNPNTAETVTATMQHETPVSHPAQAPISPPAQASDETLAKASTESPNIQTKENTERIPLPQHRPTTTETVASNRVRTQTKTDSPELQHHFPLAPGPHSLSVPPSSSFIRSRESGDLTSREEAMVGDLATVVQRKLTVLGYEDVPQNGKFDTATRNAVRDFQTNSGLPATGEMDSQTLKLLNSMSFIR